MEAPMMQPQPVGQPAFFYYNPESGSDHRQHGHFSQHPSAGHEDVSIQKNQRPYYYPGMMHCHPHMMYPHIPPQSVSMAPQPVQQKAILASSEPSSLTLNTQCHSTDADPCTPALSSGRSGSSTPPSSCGMMPTPTMSPYYVQSIIEGVKEGCEGDVKNEILAGGEFTRACSPPLTPVFVLPQSTASQAADLLSINSCPSLSPSPSPGPQSAFSDSETTFCNPRNLLVNSTQVAQPILDHFPQLPTLCSGDDEEHKLILGGDYTFVKSESCLSKSFDTSYHGLPNFDSFSDLDSENDFVTDLTRFAPDNIYYNGNKRQRLDLIPFDDDSLVSEDSFEEFEDSEQFASAGTMTPPEAEIPPMVETSSKPKSPKKSRSPTTKKSGKKSPGRSVSRESDVTAPQISSVATDTGDNQQSSAQESTAVSVDDNNVEPNTPGSTTSMNPSARRGRKQSLTDDPSKTFVCTLCSRRFRRQEHLKRHYRSLHTHDKPFACQDCGKQFSRSDNLSQHQRTHGSGAITLGVLEEGELAPQQNGESVDPSDVLGARLYEAAAAAAGSSSSSSSDGSQRDSASPAPLTESTKTQKKAKTGRLIPPSRLYHIYDY